MRDALSIFDQLVSFAGNEITYNTVLENLNVLDYEYFFKITDQILHGDISGTLLTINDIIDKGFEGQHFLIGFGEHLRNLLVCKDAATAILLETAPSIRNQYVEQAGRCQIGILLQMLDLNNKCDLNYKTSNNKRLHLELSLMQMCANLMHQGSAPALMQATVHMPPVPDKPSLANPILVTAREINPSLQGSPVQPVVLPVKVPDSEQAHGEGSLKKPVETVKMRDIKNEYTSATTIKKVAPKTVADISAEEEQARDAIATPFSKADLIICWDEYADKLKNQAPHLYSTLKNSRPVILEDWKIGFTLDNKVLDDELTSRKTEMMEFLRMNLNNYKLQLQTTIAESQKTLKPYTDKEKFDLMAGKNPALRNLREELDLEIEY
jgi:DNA polymerase-3 subunit gamma/tau